MHFTVDYSAKSIGARLKTARNRMRFTQEQVETDLGLGGRVLPAYEQGVRIPSDEVLVALADKYNTHPAVLRYGESVLEAAALGEASSEIQQAADLLASLARRLSRNDQAPKRQALWQVVQNWGDLASEGDLRRRRLISEFEMVVHAPPDRTGMHPEDAERITAGVVPNIQAMLDIYESASPEERQQLKQSFYWAFEDAFNMWLDSTDGSGFPLIPSDVLRTAGYIDAGKRRDARDALNAVTQTVEEREQTARTRSKSG